MIHVKDLHKSFGQTEVLKGITETISQGEVVAIIGPSGSGKSTFLRCLNLLEVPTSGEIIVDGENILNPRCNVNLVRRKMGMVFQQFNLFAHLTVMENITLAPVKQKLMGVKEATEKARYLLDRVGVLEKADNYPVQLSGGQQ